MTGEYLTVMREYLTVGCPFCHVSANVGCVITRGPRKGQESDHFHALRAYAWMDLGRQPREPAAAFGVG